MRIERTNARLLATASLLAMAAPAVAQTANAATAVPTPVAASTAVEEAAIIVTGSRIVNPGTTSPMPLTIVDATKIQQIAPSSVDDIISQLPAFRSNSGPNQVQRNAGSPSTAQSLANLRGLGAQRTLLLVDGRRQVPTNAQGTTSTSIIPVGLVKRLEIVTGGASAAYGSDAVAGVANFIINDRFVGLQGSILTGISQRGDNHETGGNIAYGYKSDDDKLHIVFGADYNKNDGVGNIYSRDWSAVEPGNSGNPIAFGASRPAGTAAFGWANGVQYATQTPGGVINSAVLNNGAPSSALNQLAFAPDGSTSVLARGPVFGNLMINSTSNPVATPIAQWNLKQPLEQFASMLRATYDFSSTTSFFVEGNYARSNVFTYSQFHQTPTLSVLIDNPFLPADMRNQMTSRNIRQINIGRVDTEWLGTSGDNTSTTYQGALGLKGQLFDRVNWDISYGYGHSNIDSKIYGTREANLMAAGYVVNDASGKPICGPLATNPNFAPNRLTNTIQVANVQPGCVPWNPFGAGNASQAAIDYVSGIQYTDITMERHTVALNLSGTLFELPAGPVSLAVGGEMRWDSLNQVADDLQIQGLYSSGNNKTYSGSNDVKEGYAEVNAPLLADIPFIHSLGINGAIRRTDYSTSGAVTTWKVGGTWEPLDGLLFRGTRSRDIRAPSLSDLYLIGGISATGSFFNPFTGQSARLPVQTLGNPALVPEIANTLSFGGTIRGSGAFSGFRASVDYYSIKVSDVIASVSATDILARCYAGNATYCASIDFDNTPFGISRIVTQPFNQSALKTEGIDIEVGYRSGLSGIGMPGGIDATVFATHLIKLQTTDIPGPTGVTLESAGYQAGAPKWVVSAFLNYRIEDFAIGLQMRTFSSIKYSPLFVGPGEAGYDPTKANSINKNTFSGQALFNLNLSYDLNLDNRKVQVFANIANLFDTNPPEYAIAAINLGGNPYDYVGRTFKIGMRFGF